MWFVLGGIVVVTVVVLFLAWKKGSSRKLSAGSAARIQSLLEKANRMQEPVLRIMEYDKILDQLLYELKFQGNTADKLKKGGVRFSNTQTLWKYHKLRNTLAHEHGAVASAADADGFRDALIVALRKVS